MARAVLLAAVLLVAVGCMGEETSTHPEAEALREYMLSAPAGDAQLRERVAKGLAIPPASDFLVVREGEWAVAAVELQSQYGAYGAPLREEDDRWKVANPQELRIVEGPPEAGAAVGFDQRVGFAVYSDKRDLRASLWIDGKKETLMGAGGPQFVRYWAVPEGLGSGRHLAVGLARAGGEAAAVAWVFDVT